MATSKRKNSAPKAEGPAPEGGGWESVNSGRADGFFDVREGATIQGIMVGHYASRNRNDQFFFHIKLTAPCDSVKVFSDVDDDYVPGRCLPGHVVSIDQRSQIAGWASQPMGKTEVWAHFKEKRKLENGNTMWIVDAKARPASGDALKKANPDSAGHVDANGGDPLTAAQ